MKEEGRTQMHNVTEKGFNKGPDRQYINKTMEHKTQDYGGGVTVNSTHEQRADQQIRNKGYEYKGMNTRA